MNFSMGFIGNSIPFWFFQPDYFCYNENNIKYQCLRNVACSMKNYDVEYSYFSIIEQFQLICSKNQIIILANVLIFVVSSIITVFLCMITDIIGRKKSLIFSQIIILLGLSLVLFFNTLFLKISGIIIIWCGTDLFYSTNFIYLNEVIGSKLRSKSTSISYGFYSLGGVILYIVTDFVKNYYYLTLIQLLLIIINLILFKFILETPFHYYNRNNKEKFELIICKIAIINDNVDKINYIKKNIEELFENKFDELCLKNNQNTILGSLKNKNDTSPNKIENKTRLKLSEKIKNNQYFKFFTNSKSWINFISMTILFSYVYLIYTLLLIVSKDIGINNININGVILCSNEIIGYAIVLNYVHKLKRKKVNNVCIFLILIISSILFIFSNKIFKGVTIIKIIQSLLTGLIKIVVCANMSFIFNLSVELFDSNVRMVTCGISIFCARMISGISPILYDLSKDLDIHPLSFGIIICLITFPFNLIIPETLNKGVK